MKIRVLLAILALAALLTVSAHGQMITTQPEVSSTSPTFTTSVQIGSSTDDVQPTLTLAGDADSDAGGDTSETLTLTLTPNADPTLAVWSFSTTQTLEYNFDQAISALGLSMSNNDAGTSNTIFGKDAGQSLDAGSTHNTFFGEGVSDATMNDATLNSCFGRFACGTLTSGDNLVAMGYYALHGNTSGGDNTAVGTQSLQSFNGSSTSAFGHFAAQLASAGSDSLIAGFYAGTISIAAASVTSITESVILGAGADPGDTSPSNEILIGYNAKGNGDNTSTFGNASITTNYRYNADQMLPDDRTHGGYIRRVYSATSGTLTGATDKIELNIPTVYRILQCQLHVKTEVADNDGDDTWSSELNDTAQVEVISAGSAKTQNTNVNHWAVADTWGTLTDAETDILLTPNGSLFTAGEIEATCIAIGFDAWDNE